MGSSSSLFNLVAVLLLALAAVAHSQHDAAPPAVECSSLILTLVDCLSFVSNGSTIDKPEGTCCSGIKTVLRTDADCLCVAFRSSAQLGVVLNVSKALTLPSACHISADSSAIKCSLPIPPTVSPPGGEAPASPPSIAPAPTKSEDTTPPPAKNSATATNAVVGTSAAVAATAVAYWLII
ncbi:hypothetical protein MLD38_032174 [Melastoma candidum]|uniref:Uncharacterized protein n=1 Tax=Melastoma candidum TaxID=119954 RepID=A0ACB9M3A2_9MYRT|nr:hypothetical protein MLD38_032174 [Melastoma candidum]